ncbi:MAG: MFS transporter [Jiangellaceae bacterium]|nr:MFS transporter [Jiangellaceae bacterium]
MSAEQSETAGQSPAASATPATAPSTGPASAWAPIRYYPVFRALWIAQFASNVGTWMQTVGAQWLLVDRSPLLVSLVQTASSLPIVMLALPAGAWADLVDRRRLLLGAQFGMFVAAATLAGTTFLGAASPAMILTLTFLLGCGNAVAGPAWQAIQLDLVDRAVLPQAAALNGVNMNLARALGPALGGVVVATAGAAWVFALNALSFVGIAAAVASWGGPERIDVDSRERLVEALRAGGRYVRNALVVRRLLFRAILFIPAASAVWALLPVVAARNLGLGSAGYGLLLGMVGIGAVGGALMIPRLRAKVGSARLVTGAMIVTAAAIALVATAGNEVLVGLALVPVGGAWIAVMSSLNSGLQLALPNWVRARGLAYYLAVFQGAQALGAVIWGAVAHRTSVTTALLGAAAALALAAVLGLRAPMPDTSKLDRTPSAHWPAPQLTFAPNAEDGPVLVTVTYRVPEHNAVAFTDAMRRVGRSRRRTGALRWELFRDGNDPTRFVESYLVGTWAEHLRQHEYRLTGADRRFEEEANRFTLGAPEVAHLFPPPPSEPTSR